MYKAAYCKTSGISGHNLLHSLSQHIKYGYEWACIDCLCYITEIFW